MRLLVVSHKICWSAYNSPSGYVTDGGFPMQMQALSELFSETKIAVPCEAAVTQNGTAALTGNNLTVCPLPVPGGEGWRRKLAMIGWLIVNGRIIWRQVKQADAVHAPIPGDVGTIGMLFAWLQKKPLFVRYCGNWLAPKTTAEYLWQWSMKSLAGGRNVMLATGGAIKLPSARNPNIKWIFSTSLRESDFAISKPKQLSGNGNLKLIIACRQEKRKGVEIVLESLPLILEKFSQTTLEVVGGGSQLPQFEKLAQKLNVEKNVTFYGKVAQKTVINLLREADLFCYPTASEGFPKVVLEALACGLPVITTPVSVLPQLIETGSGCLLNELTARALAKAVIEISSNQKLYEQMSFKALQTARQYSLENWRDQIGETLRTAWNVRSLSE